MLDSMFTYLLSNLLGVNLPVNAFIPVLILLSMIFTGIRIYIPPLRIIFYILIMMFGFFIGMIILKEVDAINQTKKIATAIIAFSVGYATIYNSQDEKQLTKYLTFIGTIYIVICSIAVLKILPSYFPIKNHIRSEGWSLIARPEVTTDQNFQIFYLVPAILGMAIANSIKKYFFYFLLLCGAALVLAKLQTRSGIIYIVFTLFMAWISPWLKGHFDFRKMVVIPAIFLVIAIIKIDAVISASELLISRFTNDDYHNAIGRIFSAEYLFINLFNPSHWLPYGQTAFLKAHGGIPHFNPTGVYLQGGIISLIGLILLQLIPTIKGGILFIKGQLDNISIVAFIGGASIFAISLSLNVVFHDQVWLWNGALIAALMRKRVFKNTQTTSYSQSTTAKNEGYVS